jgi:hypothetical protein
MAAVSRRRLHISIDGTLLLNKIPDEELSRLV